MTKIKATEAIFWNRNKYQLLKKKIIRFNQICDNEEYAKYVGVKHENNKFYQRIKSRGDVYMVLYLNEIKSDKKFVLLSSHLFYDPNWSDVKLLQCILLNVSLYKLLQNEWKLDISNVAIIFGVDANSMSIKMKSDEFDKDFKEKKGIKSGVYELMTNGFVDKSHSDHPKTRVNLRNYQIEYWEINEDENIDELKEQIRFVQDIDDYDNKDYGKIVWKSAYNINGNEPIYSTKTDKFCATLIIYFIMEILIDYHI